MIAQPGEVALDALAQPDRRADGGALEVEGGGAYIPAPVHLTHDVARGHAYVLEEHLVEVVPARHVHQAAAR